MMYDVRCMNVKVDESARYLFDRIQNFAERKYCPTVQDLLRCRVRTRGVTELNFHVDMVPFRFLTNAIYIHHTHTCTRTHARTYTHTRAHTHIHTHTHTYTHIHTRTHTHTHELTGAHILTHSFYFKPHTYTHTY